MSLSWLHKYQRKTVAFIGIHAVRIELPNGKVLDEKVITTDASSSSNWQSAVDTLDRIIVRELASLKKKHIELIVANQFVRYVIAPWTERNLSQEEYGEWINMLLEDRFGESVDTWLSATERTRFRKSCLAAAISSPLVELIVSRLKNHGYHAHSIQPAAIAHLNHHRQQLPDNSNGWFVDATDTRLAIFTTVNGDWVNVINEPMPAHKNTLAAEMISAFRRDAIRWPQLISGTVYLHCGHPALLEALMRDFKVVRLIPRLDLPSDNTIRTEEVLCA